MEIRFKPKFWKDIQKVKNDKEVVTALDKVFSNVEKAKTIQEINNIKKLDYYQTRFRIKIYFDKKRDFRIGLYIMGNTVWFAGFLPRKKIYEENW